MSVYGSSSVSVLGDDPDNDHHHHHHRNNSDEEDPPPPPHRVLGFGEELIPEEQLPDDDDDDYYYDEDDASASSSSSWVKGRTIDVDSLHTEQVPNVNGNLGPDGQFHKWHETYAVPSINGELLHILPYTVIDF
jgi:hypothetical protein